MFDKNKYISAMAPSNTYDSMIKDTLIYYPVRAEGVGTTVREVKNVIYNFDVGYTDTYLNIDFTSTPIYRFCVFIEGDMANYTIGTNNTFDIELDYYYETIANVRVDLDSEQMITYIEQLSDILTKVIIIVSQDYDRGSVYDGRLQITMPAGSISEINAMVF